MLLRLVYALPPVIKIRENSTIRMLLCLPYIHTPCVIPPLHMFLHHFWGLPEGSWGSRCWMAMQYSYPHPHPVTFCSWQVKNPAYPCFWHSLKLADLGDKGMFVSSNLAWAWNLFAYARLCSGVGFSQVSHSWQVYCRTELGSPVCP